MAEGPTYILVCGSRTFADWDLLDRELSRFVEANGRDSPVIVTGGCPSGADEMAKRWALDREYPVIEFRADWDKHGKAAGPIRNREMAQFIQRMKGKAIAFWDEISRGTENAIDECENFDVPMTVVYFTNGDSRG